VILETIGWLAEQVILFSLLFNISFLLNNVKEFSLDFSDIFPVKYRVAFVNYNF
jgi:hypothetical protein